MPNRNHHGRSHDTFSKILRYPNRQRLNGWFANHDQDYYKQRSTLGNQARQPAAKKANGRRSRKLDSTQRHELCHIVKPAPEPKR